MPKTQITVEDVITMTRLAGQGTSSPGGVATVSRDGSRFALVLQKANLEHNTNEFSLLVFEAKTVLSSAKPTALLTLSSSSNREAIHDVKWLSDNETVMFIGENHGETSQVYRFDVRNSRLERVTGHSTPITAYDVNSSGQQLVFLAEASTETPDSVSTQRDGVVITSQYLRDILAGDPSKSWESQVFVEKPGEAAVRVPTDDALYENSLQSLSPDGRYAIVEGYIRSVPALWRTYQDDPLQGLIFSKMRQNTLRRLLLIDTRNGSSSPVLDVPMAGFQVTWKPDSRQVSVRTYLPLDITDAKEREERRKHAYDVTIDVSNHKYWKTEREERQKPEQVSSGVSVTLDQDLNTPPRLYVSESTNEKKTQLLDLNPQFASLSFGPVKIIEWRVDGIEMLGGLYLPPDYSVRKRYPLVIQTHGFVSDEFSMDGLSEWSSAFAARALAANGMMVLQAAKFKDRADHDRVAADRILGATAAQSFKTFNAHVYEGAIDKLEKEGVIDPTRVGIAGFSRTVSFVGYLLTHSHRQFAAASLVDGIDAGYFQTIAWPDMSWDVSELNGGVAPFGEGLQVWFKESPTFNLNKIHAPLRLVALGPSSVLEMWEWFSGLKLQDKPVDLIEIPFASHLIVKPWERKVAQQGMVDWFRFWLKGEEDPDLRKADQYKRWRELRKLQEKADASGIPVSND